MSNHTLLAAALALLLPVAASAQSSPRSDDNRPSLVFFANGGGYSPLTEISSDGSGLNTGWSLGGGAGIQLNRFVSVRGTFDYGQDKGEPEGTAFEGERLKHYFYGGDVQLRYPTPSGFAPYLLAGAGAVTIDGSNIPTLGRFTKFAGKGGLGLEYNLPSGLGLFVQGVSYFYKFDRGGFNKTQADLLWDAGLSYRL